MANIIQSLITEFELKEDKYKTGAKAVQDDTLAITRALGAATSTIDKFKDKVGSIFERLSLRDILSPIAALATGAGLVELGKDAVETSNKFDMLERKLAALTGSYERAQEIMKFSEGQSMATGLFNPAELDEASAKLAAFGLNAETYLPMVEQIGAVFGNLDEPIEAFGRIAMGNTSRAIMMLSRLGISVDMLKAHGMAVGTGGAANLIAAPAEVDWVGKAHQKKTTSHAADLKAHGIAGSGKGVAGGAEEILAAIQGAVTEKYGKMLGEMEGDNQSKLMRISVAWETAMRKIGTSIMTALGPSLTALGVWLDRFANSGQLERIVSNFSKLFGLDGTSFTGFLQRAANVLENLPSVLGGVVGVLKVFFGYIFNSLEVIAVVWAGVWGGKLALGAMQAVAAAMDLLNQKQGVMNTLLAIGQALLGNWKNLAVATAVGAAFAGSMYLLLEKVRGSVKNFDPGFGPVEAANKVAQAAALSGMANNAQGTIADRIGNDYLGQIADNTSVLKDIKKYAFGGGDLARIGVTPAELQLHRRESKQYSGSMGTGAKGRLLAEFSRFLDQVGDSSSVGDLMRYGAVQTN